MNVLCGGSDGAGKAGAVAKEGNEEKEGIWVSWVVALDEDVEVSWFC